MRSKLITQLSYLVMIGVFAGGLWLILSTGSRLISDHSKQQASNSAPAPAEINKPTATENRSTGAGSILWENLRSPLSILLLQIVVVITIARIFRGVFRKLGQPPVMGEMVAGLFLGPSLLGLISPATMAFLFPASSMVTLRLLSQIGVVLFMFVVGMELNVQHVREKGSAAVLISHASIVVPFLLGAALSLYLYGSLAPANTSFNAFALFIGVAMSITAFPVLARILEDRKMLQTRLGSIALTCAAVDDATAWCLLALVIAIVKSVELMSAAITIGLALGFTLLMLFVAKPQLERLVQRRLANEQLRRGIIPATLAFVLLCAMFTEVIGIHALFGAFLAGVVMPSGAEFRLFLKEKLETFSSAALLPLFFVFTGLRTQVGLIGDWNGWLLCGAIVIVAIVGKLGGSTFMARWTGMSWQDSVSVGILMNTRGLVELVVLNIGYDLGILSDRIFTMMVLMALVTTFMTGPLLSLAKRAEQVEPNAVPV
jgi:Kef-type K+ transport system membrane component KefB